MALIPWHRWVILEFFSEVEIFMDDVNSMGDDTLEATTLVMGGSDVAIMADVEDLKE